MIDFNAELVRLIEYMTTYQANADWMGVFLNQGEPVIAFSAN